MPGYLFDNVGYWLLGRYFVAARTRRGVLRVARRLMRQGFDVTLNFLGEHNRSEEAVEEAVREYLRLIFGIWKELRGGSIAVKPTQIGLEISESLFRANLERILEHANKLDVSVQIDMEDPAHVQPTLEIYSAIVSSDKYRLHPTIAIQANLIASEELLERYKLFDCPVRLVKGGAYGAEGTIVDEDAIRERFIKMARRFLEYAPYPQNAEIYLATVRDRILANKIRQEFGNQRQAGRPWKFQLLYGPWGILRDELAAAGYGVSIYIPYGRSWFKYGIRRWQFIFKIIRERIFPAHN